MFEKNSIQRKRENERNKPSERSSTIKLRQYSPRQHLKRHENKKFILITALVLTCVRLQNILNHNLQKGIGFVNLCLGEKIKGLRIYINILNSKMKTVIY